MEGAKQCNSLLVGADKDCRGSLVQGQQLLPGSVPALAGKGSANDRPRVEACILNALAPAELSCVEVTTRVGAHDQSDVFVTVANEVRDRHACPFLESDSDRVDAVISSLVVHCGWTSRGSDLGAVIQEHYRNVRLFQIREIRLKQLTPEEQSIHPPGGEVIHTRSIRSTPQPGWQTAQ